MMKPLPDMTGILLVDKPQGWTSHDVCAFLRKKFKIKKVGHAGTLDPLATGLLVVLLGRATKFSMTFSESDKVYCGALKLGVATDSHDLMGKVLEEKPWDTVTLEMIRQQAKNFTGEIFQTPPMVSALKFKGVRLYKLARQGVTVPRQERPVTVHELTIEKKENELVYFSAHVSKGTYVRTLVHDLGNALGCSAALASLQRKRAGQFHVEDSLTVDALKQLSADELRPRIISLSSLSLYADSERS